MNVKDRWSAPTPKKLKEVQKALIAILVALVALEAGSIEVEGVAVAIELPEFVNTIVKIFITISAVGAFVLQLFTNDDI